MTTTNIINILFMINNLNVCGCHGSVKLNKNIYIIDIFFGHVPMLTFVGVKFFGHILTKIWSS